MNRKLILLHVSTRTQVCLAEIKSHVRQQVISRSTEVVPSAWLYTSTANLLEASLHLFQLLLHVKTAVDVTTTRVTPMATPRLTSLTDILEDKAVAIDVA